MLITATVAKPPMTVKEGKLWLLQLVDLVGMKVLIPPRVVWCDDPDNEGLTGIVGLTTSHASFHAWSAVPQPFIQCDLYSCAPFSAVTVLNHLEQFQPIHTNYRMIDRSIKA